ncbi:hypothetical protein [Hymenobacter weizhouensis]|uniref:hypothetical protein n=1 Tax=Hymenobacter sp. YIM 151500-1 TaxID=2987689 RepID=UPI0022279693|nr:hypothetical protein [Hymenobacter sp. YIM 151500-1]UYZ62513.1 hypothetical protein OIS53_16115 [Hymenobacter sp. YIM 151500-1]
MNTENLTHIVSGLHAMTGGQPRALEQLVTQYATGALQQAVPADVAQVAAVLPVSGAGGELAVAPQKLEAAFQHVLGTLNPEALQTLQRITQVLPGGLTGLVADPTALLNQQWFGQVGQHLLREAVGPELHQFMQTGQEVLLASAGPQLPLAGALPTGWNPNAPSTALQKPDLAASQQQEQLVAAASKQNKPKKPKQKAKPAGAKPPVRTGWLNAKKERYEQRLELIKKAKAKQATLKSPKLIRAIDRLEFNNKAVERLRLSGDAYNYKFVTPADYQKNRAKYTEAGWRQIETKYKGPVVAESITLRRGNPPEGWTPELLHYDKKSGINAVLYKSSFEPGGRPVLAFGGTEVTDMGQFQLGGAKVPSVSLPPVPGIGRIRVGGFKLPSVTFPSIPADISVDIKQGIGIPTRQYDHAVALARQVKNQYPGVEFTGHSLGGGLAGSTALITQTRAFTFNAAGVHRNTLKRFGLTDAAFTERGHLVHALHSSGDPLSWIQDSPPVFGQPGVSFHGNIPQAVGIRHQVGTGGHDLGPMEQAIEQQKAADIALMHQYVAGKKR